MRLIAIGVLAIGAAGCSDSNDPCDGAASGDACVFAGTGDRGFNNQNPTANRLDSKLYYPTKVAFDDADRAYIVDWNNHMIRRVEASGSLVTVVGTDYEGDGPPEMEDRLPTCNPTGAPGTTVAMNHPTDAEFGPDGKLYIAAWHNNKIRVFDPVTDRTTALAGNGYGYTGDDGAACLALFNQPKAVTLAPDGTVYTIDQRNVRIREISAGENPMIRTIGGMGVVGNLGDGGQALDAQWGFETIPTPRPSGALLVHNRSLFVADSLNNRIRRIDLDTGVVDCIAGDSAAAGYSGDGGDAHAATFNFPMDLEIGPDGRLYVADRYNNAIRAIDLATNVVETVAGGIACDGEHETCADRGKAIGFGLNWPYGVSFDKAGSMYIADTHNSRIIKVAQ